MTLMTSMKHQKMGRCIFQHYDLLKKGVESFLSVTYVLRIFVEVKTSGKLPTTF